MQNNCYQAQRATNTKPQAGNNGLGRGTRQKSEFDAAKDAGIWEVGLQRWVNLREETQKSAWKLEPWLIIGLQSEGRDI